MAINPSGCSDRNGAIQLLVAVEGAIGAVIFEIPEDCRNLVGRFKLAAKPVSRVAAHGVADDQGSLDMVTSGALESAEFVTRRAGRHAGEHCAGLAVLTARALYGAQPRTGG
jgi:hypothetical protein